LCLWSHLGPRLNNDFFSLIRNLFARLGFSQNFYRCFY
jgi:hypothetical protein